MKRKLLIIGMLLGVASFSNFNFQLSTCLAQTEVTPFVPGTTVDGVNYFLPQTALRITIVAEKTVTVPGELSKYAFRYLRMKDVPTATATTWRIKSVTAEPYGVPDPQKTYNVRLKQKTVAPLASLTRDGILLAINTEATESTLPTPPQGTPAPAALNPKLYMNQEMLTAGSTAKLAELCAQEIYDIRDSRNALIRGEADNTPKDGQQLQLMLDQLDTQARALEQLFVGYSLTSTEVFTFSYLPTRETDRELLCRFSQMEGVVDRDNLSGQPIYISVQGTGSLPPRSENPETDKKKSKMQERGIYYNVPAREAVSIYDLNYVYLKMEISMGQFGYTEILSDVLFDKKPTTRVTFHQQNGALQHLEQ